MALPGRPARMSLTNVETGVTLEPLYNPTKLDTTISVDFDEIAAHGHPAPDLHYKNTKPTEFALQLAFDGLSGKETGGTSSGGAKSENADFQRRFLESLCFPMEDGETGPPRVHLFWPNLRSVVCRVTEVKETDEQFFRDLASLWFVAELKLRRIPRDGTRAAFTSEHVLKHGLWDE